MPDGGAFRCSAVRVLHSTDQYFNIGAAKGLQITDWAGANVYGTIEYDASGDLIFSTKDQSAVMTIKNDGTGVIFGGTQPGIAVEFVKADSTANGLSLRNFADQDILEMGVGGGQAAEFKGTLGITGLLTASNGITVANDAVLALGASGTDTTFMQVSDSGGLVYEQKISTKRAVYKLSDATGDFTFQSPTANIFRISSEGIITGTSSVPTSIATGAVDGMAIDNTGTIRSSRVGDFSSHAIFYNGTAGTTAGSIRSNGAGTQYVTTSEPRLKNFFNDLTDDEINSQWNSVMPSVKVFEFKSDPGNKILGFDAHKLIDAKPYCGGGAEGEGPRDAEIGSVYDTTEEEYEFSEERTRMVDQVSDGSIVKLDAEGNPELDGEGNEVFWADGNVVLDAEGNAVQVEETYTFTEMRTRTIEHKVTPAGVDQAKLVPLLMLKIEQDAKRINDLETRLSALEAN